tara:strand:- start:101 stop:688 length:588 start_codon:yes stop_codon:yes gene_type:complete
MANRFDIDQAPDGQAPETIIIGDYLLWKRTDLVSDYPLATHSMEYVARITGGGSTEIKVAATETNGTYVFEVDSVTSTGYTAGFYHWQLEATETASGNRAVIERGTFTAVEDLDVNGADPRSHAEIMITKIESILQGKADADVSSYSINGRSLTKMSFQDLIDARDYFRKEYAKERQKERALAGETTGATILVRF